MTYALLSSNVIHHILLQRSRTPRSVRRRQVQAVSSTVQALLWRSRNELLISRTLLLRCAGTVNYASRSIFT